MYRVQFADGSYLSEDFYLGGMHNKTNDLSEAMNFDTEETAHTYGAETGESYTVVYR